MKLLEGILFQNLFFRFMRVGYPISYSYSYVTMHRKRSTRSKIGAFLVAYKNKKQINLLYTSGITLKRVISGGAELMIRLNAQANQLRRNIAAVPTRLASPRA